MTQKALLPRLVAGLLAAHMPFGAGAAANPPSASQVRRERLNSYPVVALDERFTALNLRKGASYDHLMAAERLWATPGMRWSDQPWTQGYGFDLHPRLDAAPADIYTITKDGLRLRSRAFTDAELAKLPRHQQTVARVNNDKLRTVKRPWIGAHISTYYSLRVRPPFYVEIEATLPPASLGRVPWPGL